jgi:hypothetical protein
MELDLVESLAATRVRLRRVVGVETGILDNHIDEIEDRSVATAFERALPSLTLLSRYESALQRTFDRTLKQLQALQKARPTDPPPILRNEPSEEPDYIEIPPYDTPNDENYCAENANSTLPESAVPE